VSTEKRKKEFEVKVFEAQRALGGKERGKDATNKGGPPACAKSSSGKTRGHLNRKAGGNRFD